jgi:hypothetical protein
MPTPYYQTLRLRPEYFAAVRRGEKRSTIRAGRRLLREGALVLASDADHLTVQVTHITYKCFHELNDEDARLDGFTDAQALRQTLYHFYPNLLEGNVLTIVYFELPDGTIS